MGGKTLITGASSDIGKAIVESLLSLDFPLILQTRNADNLANFFNQDSSKLAIIESELSSPTEIENIWLKCQEDSTYIENIIHVASYTAGLSNDIDINWWSMWEESMRINVIAPTYLAMLASQYFKENNVKGKLINITSRAAHQGDQPDKMHYAAAKAALNNATKTIAKNFQHYNIYSYNIAPSYVKTKRIEETILVNNEDKWIEENTPLKSLIPPKEIAEIVEFILTKQTENLTGSTFDINGATYLR